MKVWLLIFGFCFSGLTGLADLSLPVSDGELRPFPPTEKAGDKVLVFTRTEDYRHRSISDGVALIRRLGRKNRFDVDRTEDPGDFTVENLRQYRLVIFLSTTGDVLNSTQESAFEAYIAGGGNFMGIHAAVDTEYEWTWYGDLVGAYFNGHPEVQPALVRVEDTEHPATTFLPDPWTRTDEWYDLKEVRDDLQVLLRVEEDSYEGGQMGDEHPVAWCREIGNSRSFYTGGGHTRASFREPLFEKHILGGILWCLHRSGIE